jgi:hypothetical protein
VTWNWKHDWPIAVCAAVLCVQLLMVAWEFGKWLARHWVMPGLFR